MTICFSSGCLFEQSALHPQPRHQFAVVAEGTVWAKKMQKKGGWRDRFRGPSFPLSRIGTRVAICESIS